MRAFPPTHPLSSSSPLQTHPPTHLPKQNQKKHRVNVLCGPEEERLLMTGLHTVCDLACMGCHRVLGWKYLKAHEPSQKYKEGKFILEKVYLYLEKEYGEEED